MGDGIGRRPGGTAFVTTLAVGAAIFCGSGSCAVSLAEGPREGVFQFPDTLAGRAAAAYFRAFNSHEDEQMRAFVRDYRTQLYLEERPIEERVDQYRKLRDTVGTLTPLHVALSLDLQLTLLAKGSNVEGGLVFRFQADGAPPHKLELLTTSGVDKTLLPDDEILRCANRARPLDGAVVQETVRAAARILDEKYIDPALGKAMADALLARLAGGRYGEARRAGQLADALTEDAVGVSKDKHVWIEAANPLRAQSTYAENRPVEELRRENYHFRKVEVLPGNIGYLKFDMIHDDKEAQTIAIRALALLKDCDALVFDLRDNVGGEFETGRLILSYVFPAGTIVSRTYDRAGRLVSTNATLEEIPGTRFAATVPVYVLTSHRTGSAAEGFIYALQQSRRGKVVGQTTLGMAHPCEEETLGSGFLISVPVYRVESAFTRKSFQGVGIIPDISVPEQNALATALKDAQDRTRRPAREK